MELRCTVNGFPTLTLGCTNDYWFNFVVEGEWDLPEEEVTFRCFPTCNDHLHISDARKPDQWCMTFSRDVRKASVRVDVSTIVEGEGRLDVLVVNHHGMPIAGVSWDIKIPYGEHRIEWMRTLRLERLPTEATS